MMKTKKMKLCVRRIAAGAMALSLAMTGVGCGDDQIEHVDQDVLHTVYLCTEVRYYNEDGVNCRVEAYEYDDRGRQLSWTRDDGPSDQAWDEEQGIMYRVDHDADGQIDNHVTLEYDEQGCLTSDERHLPDLKMGYQWKYEADLPVRLKSFPEGVDPGEMYVQEIRRDAAGNCVGVYLLEGVSDLDAKVDGSVPEKPVVRAEYDENGRMTLLASYTMERAVNYEYEYDTEGRLTKVTHYTSPAVNHYMEASELAASLENAEKHPKTTTLYRYDENGRLIEKDYRNDEADEHIRMAYRYDDDGHPVSIEHYLNEALGVSWTFTYDEGTLTSAIRSGLEGSCLYDANGNLTEQVTGTGTVIRYQYRAVSLSEADAMQYHRRLQQERELGSDGNGAIDIPVAYESLFPVPVCPELTELPQI